MLPGLGALVIPKSMNIQPQIAGSQNGGLRGGTESAAMCSGAIKTMEITFANRVAKNEHLRGLTYYFKQMLEKHRRPVPMSEYVGLSDYNAYKKSLAGGPSIVYINIPGTLEPINTVLVSFIDAKPGARFCNLKFRDLAHQKNIKISIGSACNTDQKGASHVLHELNLPFIVRAGVIRVSFGDCNTFAEIDEFERRLIA